MFYLGKNTDDLENLNELASLHNQVEDLRLQDKLRMQKIHKDVKKYLKLLMIQL